MTKKGWIPVFKETFQSASLVFTAMTKETKKRKTKIPQNKVNFKTIFSYNLSICFMNEIQTKGVLMLASSTNSNALALFKFKAFSLSLSLLLAFFLSFTLIGCGGGSSGSSNSGNAPLSAQAPEITTQPQSDSYTVGDFVTIRVTATPPTDGGTLTYQWYSKANPQDSGGTLIVGADGSSYSFIANLPSPQYYFAVVTNTNNGATETKTVTQMSDTAAITITLPFYNVSFYSTELDLLGTVTVPKGIINTQDLDDDAWGVSAWYKVTEGWATTTHNLTQDIAFYALRNVYEITNQDQLDDIRNRVGHNYILLNDIELDDSKAGFEDGNGWLPIGDFSTIKFTGVFNGGNHKITNLWINRPSNYDVGLFGYIEDSTIKNLGVETADSKKVQGAEVVGIIVGSVGSSSVIENSYAIGNVSGTNRVGGIAGRIRYGSAIINSYSDVNINAGSGHRLGGIVGEAHDDSVIKSSYATVNIDGGNYLGGIVGEFYNNSTIINSHTDGYINGTKGDIWGGMGQDIGGIAGLVTSNSNILNSYSTANIDGVYEVGGIAGELMNGIISNSYSTGNINGVCGTGGIAGMGGTISNSYAAGNINETGSSYCGTGGIVGRTGDYAVQNSVAINPSVTGTGWVNRITGTSTVLNNFALDTMTVTGTTAGSAGTSKTDAELKTQATYSDAINGDGLGGLGWKFGNDDDNPWKIDEGNGYPYLYWQD
jgi:hypothetical protein